MKTDGDDKIDTNGIVENARELMGRDFEERKPGMTRCSHGFQRRYLCKQDFPEFGAAFAESNRRRGKAFQINLKVKQPKFQISAKDPEGKVGTYFDIRDGSRTVVGGTVEKPDLELEFKSIPHLNAFFAGKSKRFPKTTGLTT